ncbi:zinc metallopeptidase [Mycolicibacterium canariasense]|uniref:Zinc metallopeptidase n=1 Tax=Mycolicibacterium canariasense TaxID=228230 RepID=A0A100WBA1_MYCCR|nr:neutral zinc metallopeptidase [Mycolicibacterium canariasense]MCV7209443.1 neutral zinc metallopeptidase [Mycolicibacterium canariasense]ORV06103.1 peptidase [Mycolicibacterium canariasense]GAS95021.1 zinc metallopeptidase [Mycolicibacterium canariasense]
MLKQIAAACTAVVVVAGCGAAKVEIPTSANTPARSKPDTSGIEVQGDASGRLNELAVQAIADLQQFWGEKFPELYDKDYEPVSGGFFAVDPSSGETPPCASSPDDVAGNAFYCGAEDVVAWDSAGLFPELQSKYGDFVIPIVMAHEWGHAIQARSNFTARTITRELQADCFAGSWARHAKDDKVFEVTSAELDISLAGILDLRDPIGTDKLDPSAHGSGFDRVGAFQDGFDNGLQRCKQYRDDDPVVLALPFTDPEDEASGGDAPYDSIVNGVPYDLEDYWTQVYPEITRGQEWVPVHGLEPFDPSSPPDCGGQSAEGFSLFYCVPDDYVGWDNAETMPRVYRQGGDYAVATLLATQYGLAALTRLGDDSDEKTSTARGDCFAGAYTASVILHNRAETSSWSISPGDLDEGIKALLVFRGADDADRQGAGFDRVRAFREGVINGAQACVEYHH